ncbi:hypothetical protein BCR43DRAFT_527872 [Syncephalastrum racemosum]|uniref:Uncharacterized protein n=1 Tax=Syncephalastrum racemosum TaxID=13706 RepID=A0A1X2H1H3_SYNRA|nr:hypothetical protein BCR43DRAFT_527872 [Syncephalastrum racemosum]
MVQGSLKKVSNPAAKKKSQQKPGKMKKGARSIAPKQPKLVKERKLQKQLSAKINDNIERQMAVKAGAVGKLTLMKKVADSAKAATDKKKKK